MIQPALGGLVAPEPANVVAATVLFEQGGAVRIVRVERADAGHPIGVGPGRIEEEAVVPAIIGGRLDRQDMTDARALPLAVEVCDGPGPLGRAKRLGDGGIDPVVVAVDMGMAVDNEHHWLPVAERGTPAKLRLFPAGLGT